jgi:hypothetical protein
MFLGFFGSTVADCRGCSWPPVICRRFFIGAGVTIAEANAGCARVRFRPRERQVFGSTSGMAIRPRIIAAAIQETVELLS